MPLSPEDSQKLTDLQKRILMNTQAGKSPHEGIERAELTEALTILRSSRATALAAGVAKAPKKAKASKPKMTSDALDALLAKKGVSLD